MANQIGSFNGRALSSNKSVQSVSNMRVNFSDGSWVDMSSGEKYVRGFDDIVIDPPFTAAGASTEKVTIGPKSYEALHLEIRDVPGCAINVQPVIGSTTVTVTLSGNKSTVDALKIAQDLDTVRIEGASAQAKGGINISGSNISIGGIGRGNSFSSISMNGMSIIGGNISVGGGRGSEAQATITVSVPQGAKVSIIGDWHSADIGNTDGNLIVKASGVGDVEAGRIKNATISIQGSSDVNIDEANGNVSLRIMGSGDICINGGKIGTLNADIMGSGDVSIRTEAEEADLTVMGSGDIYVARVKNRPSKNASGSGDIKVGNW